MNLVEPQRHTISPKRATIHELDSRTEGPDTVLAGAIFAAPLTGRRMDWGLLRGCFPTRVRSLPEAQNRPESSFQSDIKF
jgi:hypothetical protein